MNGAMNGAAPCAAGAFRHAVAALMLLLCLGNAWTADAHSSIRWQIDRAQIALGEPVLLTLTQPLRSAPSLENLDLTAALGADFEIHSRTFGRDAQREELRLELYPLHDGMLPLHLPGKPQGPAQIEVSHGSATAPEVELRIFAEPAQWIMRQPVRLTIEACAAGTLVWQAPQLASHTGLAAVYLGEEQVNRERNGVPCNAQRWHWSVTPMVAGPQSIVPGMLQAGSYGKILRYPAPGLRLDAQPVPLWLPQGIAVGMPAFATHAQQMQQTPPQVGQPWEWRWQIEGAYSLQTLRALLREALKDRPEWSRFAPDVRPLARTGARPLWEVRLFGVPATRGKFDLPAFGLPWYDAEAQALRYLPVSGASLTAADPMRERLLLIGQASLAVLLAAAAGALLWRRIRWRLVRRRMMHAVSKSRDLPELQHHLLGLAVSKERAAGRTLDDWAASLQAEWKAEGLAQWLAQFHRARFGAHRALPLPFEDLQRRLLAVLREAGPRRSTEIKEKSARRYN